MVKSHAYYNIESQALVSSSAWHVMMSSMAPSLPSLTSVFICLRSALWSDPPEGRVASPASEHNKPVSPRYFTACLEYVGLCLSHITLLVPAVFTGESETSEPVSEMFFLRCWFSCSASYRGRETHPSVNMLEERLENSKPSYTLSIN